MPAVFANMWAAETGGLEEVASVSGSPSVSSANASILDNSSCKYHYRLSALADILEFDPDDAEETDADDYIIGFRWEADDVSPTAPYILCELAGVFRIRNTPGGTWQIQDANDITIRSLTDPVVINTPYYIEVYVRSHATAGIIEVFIDEISQGVDTGLDTVAGARGNLIFNGFTSDIFDINDIYFIFGAESRSDRLGPVTMHSYQSNTVGVSSDVGPDLPTGEDWSDCVTVPFTTDSVFVTVTDQTFGSQVTCNDVGGSAGTGGPETDANIDIAPDGSFSGQKLVVRKRRTTGAGGTSFRSYGGTTFFEQSLNISPTLTTAFVNYFKVDTDPFTSYEGEYLTCGIRASGGGRDMEVSGLMTYIAHRAYTSRAIVYNPAKRLAPMLVR